MNDKSQRQKILDAASAILNSAGPDALRVRDIAAAAGCSTMGVYSYFGGKEGLADAIYCDGFQRLTEALLASQNERGSDNMRRSGEAYRTWALANPGPYRVMFTGAIPGHVPSDEALTTASATYQAFVNMVMAEQSIGRVRDGDPSEITWGLWGLVHGLVMLEIAGMTPPPPAREPDEFYRSALAGIGDYLGVATDQ